MKTYKIGEKELKAILNSNKCVDVKKGFKTNVYINTCTGTTYTLNNSNLEMMSTIGDIVLFFLILVIALALMVNVIMDFKNTKEQIKLDREFEKKWLDSFKNDKENKIE